jgi:hypothetical protein
MTAIGGFLPLEISAAGDGAYHSGAVAMASGRACWHVILRTCRPSRVLLPFYVCDAVLRPLAATRTPFEFYPLTEAFLPAGEGEPADGELMLVVNYFGVLSPFVEARAGADPSRIVVDDTQAFFRRGRPDAWSFNSARKFFGVPDGGFLYGPALDVDGLEPVDGTDCEHLLTGLSGDDGKAWDQFKQHEARIGIEPRAMSVVSTRLLGAADLDRARRRRQTNFEALHRLLGPLNTIRLSLGDAAAEGPMCYPFLPATDVDRTALSRLGVFVPTLWPEVPERIMPGFEWERLVAGRLLPLPIDHRYGPCDMDKVYQTLLQVLR